MHNKEIAFNTTSMNSPNLSRLYLIVSIMISCQMSDAGCRCEFNVRTTHRLYEPTLRRRHCACPREYRGAERSNTTIDYTYLFDFSSFFFMYSAY